MALRQEAVIVTSNPGAGVSGVVVASPTVIDAWTENRRYNIEGGRNLGIIQLLLGIASMVSGITIAATPYIGGFTTNTPAWAGAFYIIAGIFGIVSVTRQSCAITGFMVFSILSSMFAFMQTIYQGRIVYWWYFFGFGNLHWIIYCCMVAAVAGFTEFIISIVSAAQCCKGATCCKCCWSCCAGCCGPPAVEVDMAVQYSNPPVNQAQVNTPTNQTGVNHPSADYPNSPYPSAAYPNSGGPNSGYPNSPGPNSGYPNSPGPNSGYPNSGNPRSGYPSPSYPNSGYPNPAYPKHTSAYPYSPNPKQHTTTYSYSGNPDHSYSNRGFYEDGFRK